MLTEAAAGLTLGLVGLSATNVDNFIVLVSAFGARRESKTAVCLGFAVGALILLAISLVFSLLGELIPVRYLGYLGVIPIYLGIRGLTQSVQQTSKSPGPPEKQSRHTLKTIIAVLVLTLAGGTDTLAVIAPLLAESNVVGLWAVCSGYMIAVMGLVALLGYALSHPAITNPLRRYGSRIGPAVMVLIGLYILVNTATDSMPG